MARKWVVRNSDNVILLYTESTTLVAGAGQTIYTDPANDALWVRGGTYDGTTYTAPAGQPVPDDISTVAGRKRAAVRAALEQLDRWDASLEASGRRGQSSAVRNLGHDLILGQRKALYRVATGGAAVTADLVESYGAMVSMGALDVTTVPSFFRLAASLNKGTWVDGDPLQWATIVSTTAAARRNLQAAITGAPVDFRAAVRDFSTVDLGTDAWVTTAILA